MPPIVQRGSTLSRGLWGRLLNLDKTVPLLSPEQLEQEMERNYRWNFTVNLLDGVMFWFGLHFASSSTIMPLFVSKLTLNPLVIGLVAVIAQAGWYLPQLIAAGFTERIAHKKAIAVNLGFFLERLPTWLWPLAALVAPTWPSLGLIIFFTGYAWHMLGAGLIAPAWQDLIARCFPVQRRGQFFGLTSFLGTGAGTLGAGLSSWLLAAYLFPYNFVTIFIISAASITLSCFFLGLTREPVQPVRNEAATREKLWIKLGQIIRQDHNFRHYLLVRLLMALGLMGLGFITVAAVQRWQIEDRTVGFFTATLLLGQAGGNLLAGLLADRFGHKLSLQIGLIFAVLAFSLAWGAPAVLWFYFVFGCLGLAIGVTIVSGVLITMEFSAPEQRPTYVGIANSVAGVGSVIGPLLGGWLASYSYLTLFAASASINLISLSLLHWYVREPRQPLPGSEPD
jgi:MFS family permease